MVSIDLANDNVKQSGGIENDCQRSSSSSSNGSNISTSAAPASTARDINLPPSIIIHKPKNNRSYSTAGELISSSSRFDIFATKAGAPSSSSSTNSSYNSIPPAIGSSKTPPAATTHHHTFKDFFLNIPRVRRSLSFSDKSTTSPPSHSKSVSFKKLQKMSSGNGGGGAQMGSPFHDSTSNGPELQPENSIDSTVENLSSKLNQTYKDRRKNYRMEKKKLADELISAIQDPTTVVMCDWLKVRTALKQWNKYFCELRQGLLFLYKSEKTHKSNNWVGTVMLRMCELIERPSKKNGFCFKLFHPLEHPIWSPKGPHGEAFTSIMFPLPISSVIFRAPNEDAGHKWMQAIELSLKCSTALLSQRSHRDSVPNTPLSVNSNGCGSINGNNSLNVMNSIDRSDDDMPTGHYRTNSLTGSRIMLQDAEIEKHFDIDDDGHTDHGEHDDSQGHQTTEDSDDSLFYGEYEYDDVSEEMKHETLKHGKYNKSDFNQSEIKETNYQFDGGNEEFGLVGDAGQTEDVPEENKSLLWTLLKQVRPGMDLSKVVLPTFILEPRSFLEKLTDYYYHCDIISKAAVEEDPLVRMKLILKWYLSGFYKKPKGLKKPYNPILGETFRCYWQHLDTDSKTFYIAEQVSHHPPVSAFYVTNRKDGFCISGSILAKSKFYGNSISAILEGTARLSLLARGEDYLINFPYAHCKGIFLGPLAFELGGKISITCEKTGYKTELDFKLKPFFGSEDQCNLVVGKLRLGNETLGTINGHWDSEIWYKDKRNGESELFWSGIDPKIKSSRLKRFVVPLESQMENESEKLWNKVTLAIQKQDQNAATVEKTVLEEAQREAVKQRNSRMEIWTPKLFLMDVSDWHYKLAELRPWDNRTDVKQYEQNYVIRTLTRHLTPKPSYIKSTKVEPTIYVRGKAKPGAVKNLFRRQNTCADPTSAYENARGEESGSGYFLTGSKSVKALSNRNQQRNSIQSQLDSIIQAIDQLDQQQKRLTQLAQSRNWPEAGGDSRVNQSGHYVVNSRPTGALSITKERFRQLFSCIPIEIRLVIVVLCTHLFLNYINSLFGSSTTTTTTVTSGGQAEISNDRKPEL